MDGPGAGGLPLQAAAPAAPPACTSWTGLKNARRLGWAAVLFILGCAAASLAMFTMLLPPAESRLLGKGCTPLTDAKVASLRAASESLLLAASAQVLAATMALLVPAWPFAVFGCLSGWHTALHAADVLWMLLVVCHGGAAHGDLAFHFGFFFAVLLLALVVGCVVSFRCR